MRSMMLCILLATAMAALPATTLGQVIQPPPPGAPLPPPPAPPGFGPAPVITMLPGQAPPGSQLQYLMVEDRPDESPVWLGLQLSPVPPPLGAHLRLDKNGVMVRNVFRDSPADRAGIDQFDVIVEVNGDKVSGDVGTFINRLNDRKPGDTVELTVLHGGKVKPIRITLADRPKNPRELKPKFDEFIEGPPGGPPDMRGRILRPGPDGWILEDLGPLPKMKELPDHLRTYIETLTKDGDSQTAEGRRIDKEGQVLHVVRKEDGSIEVKRYQQADGERNAKTHRYANMDELRDRDREAFDLLNSAQRERRVLKGPKGPGTFESPEAWEEWLRKHGDKLKELEHRMQDSIEKQDWDKRWEEWNDRFFQGPLKRFRDMPAESPPDASTAAPQPPRVRFERLPDGRIIVHLRDGDAEMAQTYDSERALKEKSPKLHERYQAMSDQFK